MDLERIKVPRGTTACHFEERSNLKMKDQYRDILKSIKKFKRICGKEYRFLPVAKEDDLISFENKFNVKLPDDYRWFLLNVANGIVNKDKWGFDLVGKVDFKNFYYEENEFNPAIPFNLDKKVKFYNSEDEENEDDDYPYEIFFDKDWIFLRGYSNGQIKIADFGCGTTGFLVINGKEFGNVWIDDFASNSEVYPFYSLKLNKRGSNFMDWLLVSVENEIQNQNEEKKWWQFWK